jgi:hypothetical protein
MTKQIQTIAFAAFTAFVLPFGMLPILGMQTAEAKQCSATMPSKPQGHWTYRLIDGRKCWYEGDSKISKALLQWPEQARAVSLSARAEQRPEQQRLSPVAQSVSTNAEKPDNQAGPEATLKDAESFEARWRPVEMRPLRN